jgi:hypothetical protein
MKLFRRKGFAFLAFLSFITLGFHHIVSEALSGWAKEKDYMGIGFDECTAHERFFWFGWRKVAVVYPDS